METVISTSLIIHIASGFTALISGLIIFILKKGGVKHIKLGRIFFYAMLLVVVSAVIIALLKSNLFLILIAVFSLFMNYSGYRSIKNKSLKPSFLDWIILVLGTINTFVMISSMNIILMVFGGISVALIIKEFRTFIKTSRNQPIPKMAWLKRHIGMMMGTYLATITAFIVTAGPRTSWYEMIQPQWLPWVLPTIILTPMIAYYTKKYVKN